MKKIKLVFIVFASATFLFVTGCGTTTQTIYLQDIEVEGPISQPPLHITNGQKAGSVTISPKISVNKGQTITGRVDHSPVNGDGIYQANRISNGDGTWRYEPSDENRLPYFGDNLTWNMSDASMGVDLDLCVSDHFALTGGLNYVVQEQNSLIGGSAGLGIYSEKTVTLSVLMQELYGSLCFLMQPVLL
jgi:hypothetical protein